MGWCVLICAYPQAYSSKTDGNEGLNMTFTEEALVRHDRVAHTEKDYTVSEAQ